MWGWWLWKDLFSQKKRRSRVCITGSQKTKNWHTYLNVDFFFCGKKKNRKGGLPNLLYSPWAWQCHHHQGSRSLAPKQYFSKSALNAKVPGLDHVRVTHISEVNIELQLYCHIGLSIWAVAAKNEHSKQHGRNKVTCFWFFSILLIDCFI